MNVNVNTAMGLAAYFACVRNISEDIAALPRGVYERQKRGRKELPNHPVTDLIEVEPNPEMSAMTFWETILSHALGWHGGFAEIVWSGDGRPAQLWPLDPHSVIVETNNRNVRYLVRLDGKRQVVLRSDQVLHIHGLGLDGLTQYALTQVAKPALGRVLASHKHAANFFEMGASTTGIIEIPTAMKDDSLRRLRESFAERYGGVGNHHKPIILENNATFKPTQSDPEKSQMVQVLGEGLLEVCRLFRMPPHKLQEFGRATWDNVSAAREEYRTDCLTPWVKRSENECHRKLFFPTERRRLYVRHNMRAQLRGDLTAQTQHYWQMFQMGVYSINDIRELEDMNPIGEEGDQHFIQANMESVDAALARSEQIKNPPEPQAQPEPEPNDDAQDGNSASNVLATLMPLLMTHAATGTAIEPENTPENSTENIPQDGWSLLYHGDAPPWGMGEYREADAIELEPEPTPEPTRDDVVAAFIERANDALEKMFRIENDKAKRAESRKSLDKWAERFYAEQEDFLFNELQPICAEHAPLLGVEINDEAVRAFCSEQVWHSRYHTDEVLVWVAMQARAKAAATDLVETILATAPVGSDA